MKNRIHDIRDALMDFAKRKAFTMLAEIIKEYSPEIEDLITSQLNKGKRGDGQSLPDYSETSVTVYGKPPGAMRLYDEGDFWEGITVVLENNGFDIIGKDRKTAELKMLYGEEILDLSDEHFQEIQNDFIKLELIEKLKQYLNENI